MILFQGVLELREPATLVCCLGFFVCVKKGKLRPRNVKWFFLKSLTAGLRVLAQRTSPKQFPFERKFLIQFSSHNLLSILQLVPGCGGYSKVLGYAKPEGRKQPAMRPVLPWWDCTATLTT